MKKNNSKPRFSIVIPTYSAVDLLIECLHSLCQQSGNYGPVEIIVVNDGGNREIEKDIESLDCNIPLTYIYQENKGPAAARNTGIRAAMGDIILFLDDDSLPTQNWLEATTDAWDKYPGFDGIGGYVKKDDEDSICCRANTDFFNWYLQFSSRKKDTIFLATCNAGYKKDALMKIGNFDESFKMASGEDRDLNIKLIKSGMSLRLEESILVYHDKDLTFRSFLKKNYNYGKSAKTIYNRYPQHNRMSRRDYTALFTSILDNYKSAGERVSAFLLLAFSQVMTVAGYHSSALPKT